MRKFCTLLLALLLAISLLAGCQQRQDGDGLPDGTGNPDFPPADSTLGQFEVQSGEEKYELLQDGACYGEVVVGSLQLSQDGSSAAAAINADLAELVTAYLAQVEDEDGAQFAADDSMYFQHELRFALVHQDAELVSITAEAYSTISGAAHEATNRYGYVYDAKTGQRLTIAEVAGSDYQETLVAAVYRQIQADGEVANFYPNLQQLLVQHLAEGQWYADAEMLYLLYQPYVIAPYTMGVVEFAVPR